MQPICIHIYIDVCVCVLLCVYVMYNIFTHPSIHPSIHLHMVPMVPTYVHNCIRTSIFNIDFCMYIFERICVCVHAYIRAYHTYIDTYVQAQCRCLTKAKWSHVFSRFLARVVETEVLSLEFQVPGRRLSPAKDPNIAS